MSNRAGSSRWIFEFFLEIFESSLEFEINSFFRRWKNAEYVYVARRSFILRRKGAETTSVYSGPSAFQFVPGREGGHVYADIGLSVSADRGRVSWRGFEFHDYITIAVHSCTVECPVCSRIGNRILRFVRSICLRRYAKELPYLGTIRDPSLGMEICPFWNYFPFQ